MPNVQPQQVLECISEFSDIDTARTLYCTLLNYDYWDSPLPLDDWTSAVIFTDKNESEFHLTSPKYEPESRYKFVIRRYVVGKYEKLRTASERLCLTYAFLTSSEEKYASPGLAVVGSSNFTAEGLTKNRELNVLLTSKGEWWKKNADKWSCQ